MVLVEKKLRQAGITFVMQGKTCEPLRRENDNLAEDLGILFDYSESGSFLKKHAERVIETKITLARGGYWAGGRAPYGFVRVLVDSQNKVIEELIDARKVRQPGCHVRIMPKDEAKIGIWLLILDLKHDGWGAKRIAQHLNTLAIPSPDFGRVREDHGVKHKVSGKWSGRTVLELCRNKAIIGLNEVGHRSEGAHRRMALDGPRLLEDADRHSDGHPRLINNTDAEIIVAATGFAPRFDPEKFAEIEAQLQQRGQHQRIPRAKDPSKYPLATRVIDMTDGCGAIMYGITKGKRAIYVCGRYLRTACAECDNNSVDAEAMLSFTLAVIRRRIELAGKRERLGKLLREIAEREAAQVQQMPNPQYNELSIRSVELQADLKTVTRRMATEEDDDRYKAIAKEFDLLKAELRVLEAKQRSLMPAQSSSDSIEAEVAAALDLFDDMNRVLSDPNCRIELPAVFRSLQLTIGLNFASAIKGKKRPVRRLMAGVIAFGQKLPVGLHGRDRVDDSPALESDLVSQEAGENQNCAAFAQLPAPGRHGCRQEELSYTKDNRGDMI